MTQAHNATLTVSNEEITVMRSELSAALYRGSQSRTVSTIAISEITGLSATEPTALNCGSVRLGGTGEEIIFSPGDNGRKALQSFIADVRDAQQGNAPAEGAVAGLNFVAFAVATGNGAAGAGNNTAGAGAAPLVHAIEYTNGQAGEAKSFNAAEFAEYLQSTGSLADGTSPLIAHNGFAHAALLHRALVDAASSAPEFTYGCTLALAREASTRAVIAVRNHDLATIAQALGVADSADNAGSSGAEPQSQARSQSTTQETDPATAARLTGEVLVQLALREHHRGSVSELFSGINFALGHISNGTHRPVLRTDLSELAGGGAEKTARTDAPTSSENEDQAASASKKSGKKAGNSGGGQPAPWQAVATPDTVPEANDDADSDHPLFGQHVTLTGEFEPFDKGRLWSDIAERGGQVGKNVTKKTTVLVVGEWAKKTSKEKRAEELNEKGQDIAIWPASKLLHVLGLDEQPPF